MSDPDNPGDLQALLDELAPLLVDGSPHAVALGLTLVSLKPGLAVMRAPYSADLVGDPDSGILHGGVITALLDHVCGLAAFSGFGGQDTPATLDLRLDYMRPAKPGLDVTAEAICLKSHGLVAFVRATAHDGDIDDPVATAQAAFMVTGASKAAQERAVEALRSGQPL
ncbi:PaaI family thioesterase [Maricaulis sp.]|uniref:PaaI family thioesterase n=1 Tax=Maricaulis sp. TaxID=1486257 RepID=UPI003A8D6A4E